MIAMKSILRYRRTALAGAFKRANEVVSKVPRRLTVVLASFVVLGGVVMVLAAPRLSETVDSAAAKASAREYQKVLRGQVDSPSGEPREGRDPSAQKQSSLAEAASSVNGNGARTEKPAAGVTGDTNSRASHADVFEDPAKTGVNSAGCYIDYGVPGEQCVRAGLAGSDGILSCEEVRTRFASGVTVSGKDRFQLDHNLDGWACGTGE